MEEVPENTLGCPSWLFDWQTNGLAYDWFPTEGNYNCEDVTIAHNCLYSETEEEEVGMEQTAENMVNPITLTTTVGHTTYNISVPVYYDVRIVDCIYHARLFNKIDLKSRIAALGTIIYPIIYPRK